jgi:methionyl-tRNA formyltransferase
VPRKQNEAEATYARKITKEDGRLDWKDPAPLLFNKVRALTPWPGAWTILPEEERQPLIKIWESEVVDVLAPPTPGEVLGADKDGLVIACGERALRVRVLQREAARRMSAGEFLAGYPIRPGQKFT